MSPDVMLAQLRRISTHGGEYGKFYDAGVRTIVEEIDATGYFTPRGMERLITLAIAPQLFTPDEKAKAEASLARLGLTVEEGAQYARGLARAEADLAHYRRPAPGSGPPPGPPGTD